MARSQTGEYWLVLGFHDFPWTEWSSAAGVLLAGDEHVAANGPVSVLNYWGDSGFVQSLEEGCVCVCVCVCGGYGGGASEQGTLVSY